MARSGRPQGCGGDEASARGLLPVPTVSGKSCLLEAQLWAWKVHESLGLQGRGRRSRRGWLPRPTHYFLLISITRPRGTLAPCATSCSEALLPCSGHAWLGLVRQGVSKADSPICLLPSAEQHSRWAWILRSLRPAGGGGWQPARSQARPVSATTLPGRETENQISAGCPAWMGTEVRCRVAVMAAPGRATATEVSWASSREVHTSAPGTDKAQQATSTQEAVL